MKQIWTTSIGKQQGIDLLNAHAQWYCNDIEPTTTYPFQNWADTGNNLWKQRNETDTDWIVRGTLDTAYFGFITQSLLDIYDPLGIVKEYYGSTLPERHLWVDGKTIGDEQSGATARANSDVYNLFAVLWDSVDNTNSQIKIYNSDGVLTEKGSSAAEDFAAHKAISLPDKRGRTAIGLDNLGGASVDVVTDASADIIGGTGGEEKHTQTLNELVNHSHILGYPINAAGSPNASIRLLYDYPQEHTSTTTSTGGGQPFNIMQPWVACNYIMRY